MLFFFLFLSLKKIYSITKGSALMKYNLLKSMVYQQISSHSYLYYYQSIFIGKYVLISNFHIIDRYLLSVIFIMKVKSNTSLILLMECCLTRMYKHINVLSIR